MGHVLMAEILRQKSDVNVSNEGAMWPLSFVRGNGLNDP